jgi:transposase-like protein
MNCPECKSSEVVMNGKIHNGKQRYKCKECNRQFIDNPQNTPISQEKKDLIDRLLLEKIPLAGIGVYRCPERWLQNYVNQKYEAIPQHVEVKKKEKMPLTIQCDEMWSFVRSKQNKEWIWLAIDMETREIVGLYVGSRDKKGANGLWASLPSVYRQWPFITLIFGNPIKQFFHLKGIMQLEKKLEKQTVLNGLIAP